MSQPRPVSIPPLPDGFRIITRIRASEIECELIDFRDHSLEAFRRGEFIKPDSDRERHLVNYGVHVAAKRCGASRRKVSRAVRYLADLAWLAASSSQDGTSA